MVKQAFMLEVWVDDETGHTKAVYFHIRDGDSAETKEIEKGRAFADYDANGRLLGVDLLAPCKVTILDKLAEQEPEAVRRFLLGAAPRELVPA